MKGLSRPLHQHPTQNQFSYRSDEHIQPGVENHQGQRLHSLSGQPTLMSAVLTDFSYIQSETLDSIYAVVSCPPATHSCEESSSTFFLQPAGTTPSTIEWSSRTGHNLSETGYCCYWLILAAWVLKDNLVSKVP